ncbi:hypothetical protein C5167_043486, partial [Papaver somniferum]
MDIVTLRGLSSKLQTSNFGKSKGLWKTISESNWSGAFDGLGISLLLTSNPSIQYTVFDQLKRREAIERSADRQRYKFITRSTVCLFSFPFGCSLKEYRHLCKVTIQAADPDDDGTEEPHQLKEPKTIS